MNKLSKLPRRYKLHILSSLLGVVLLAMLPTSRTRSPNDYKIAFRSSRDGNEQGDLYLMDHDGKNPIKIVDSTGFGGEPLWSPDGSKIAYIHDMRNYGVEDVAIFVMDADGSNRTRLADNLLSDGAVMWSPDGLKLAFVRYNDEASEDASTYHTNLYVINADGTNQTKITHGTTDIRYIEAWSSNSRKIYYHVNVRNNLNEDRLVDALYLVDADGTNRTGLMNIEN